jgi:hypothetical protein
MLRRASRCELWRVLRLHVCVGRALDASANDMVALELCGLDRLDQADVRALSWKCGHCTSVKRHAHIAWQQGVSFLATDCVHGLGPVRCGHGSTVQARCSSKYALDWKIRSRPVHCHCHCQWQAPSSLHESATGQRLYTAAAMASTPHRQGTSATEHFKQVAEHVIGRITSSRVALVR